VGQASGSTSKICCRRAAHRRVASGGASRGAGIIAVGIPAVVPRRDVALIGDIDQHPGQELQRVNGLGARRRALRLIGAIGYGLGVSTATRVTLRAIALLSEGDRPLTVQGFHPPALRARALRLGGVRPRRRPRSRTCAAPRPASSSLDHWRARYIFILAAWSSIASPVTSTSAFFTVPVKRKGGE